MCHRWWDCDREEVKHLTNFTQLTGGSGWEWRPHVSHLNSAAVRPEPRSSGQPVQCLWLLPEQRAVMTLREPRQEMGYAAFYP